MIASEAPRFLVIAALAAACIKSHRGVLAFSVTTIKKPSSTNIVATKNMDLDMVRKLQKKKEDECRSKHDSVAWNRLFVDVPEQADPIALDGDFAPLPRDFPRGCLLRLGPMGAQPNEGFFDGDGMIQCVTFPPPSNSGGKRSAGTFSSTYVDTEGRKLERMNKEGKKFLGTLGSPPRGLPLLQNILQNVINFRTLQGQKDTCNTALAEQDGRVLALMEQCPPSEIEVTRTGRVETIASNCRLDDAIDFEPITGGSLSAHGRTCRQTGERIHVSYTSNANPYVRVDVYADGWKLQKSIGVNVDCPTMIHDCVITDNYIVIFDFPLTLRTTRFLKDQFPVEYEPEYGARIGLLRRDAVEDTTVWFDCQPGIILHAVNAYEKADGNVVVQALRSDPSITKGFLEEYSSSFLYEYNLDVASKTVAQEGCLNPNEIVEFPVIHESNNGQPTDYVYCAHVGTIGGTLSTHRLPEVGITIDGVAKMGLKDDDKKGQVVGQYTLDDRWYAVSEPTVVPKTRTGDVDDDDSDGEYVLLLATHVPNNGAKSWQDIPDSALKSRVLLLDGDRLDDGPVWQCDLPQHVPYGLHSAWLPWDCMK